MNAVQLQDAARVALAAHGSLEAKAGNGVLVGGGRADTLFPRRAALLMAAVVSTVLLAGCERAKTRLDREVDRLCAIDGGVKVFETVSVSAGDLSEKGPIFPKYESLPFGERLGPDYQLKASTQYLIVGDPGLLRMETKVIRKRDKKVMGSSTTYARTGGDFIGPAEPSSYACPPLDGIDLGRAIFVKQGVAK